MMRDSRSRALPITLSTLIALGLTILPLPDVLDAFRPDFVVLVVLYWAIVSPQSGGLALPFFAGLALDVIQGVVLGQHALALVLMAAWTTNIRLRLRVFPLRALGAYQQALAEAAVPPTPAPATPPAAAPARRGSRRRDRARGAGCPCGRSAR